MKIWQYQSMLVQKNIVDKVECGVEEVKRQCRIGNIPHVMTKKGYYKIEVYDNDVVSKKQYDQVVEENAKLKTTVINMKSILNQIQV